MNAVILLGHGSRAVGADRGIEDAAKQLAARRPELTVRVAHMELCQPDLETVVVALHHEQRRNVVILPYFLHEGHHLKCDIPQQLEELRAKHPDMTLVLGPHLGFDPRLVDVLEQRLHQVTCATSTGLA
jgi:sirohydrochlorin cobaltochelatase